MFLLFCHHQAHQLYPAHVLPADQAIHLQLSQPHPFRCTYRCAFKVAKCYSIGSTYILSSTLPSKAPSTTPSALPSAPPTINPSSTPSIVPLSAPTYNPTQNPRCIPSTLPTIVPSTTPTIVPSLTPSIKPSTSPTLIPSTTSSSSPILSCGCTVSGLGPSEIVTCFNSPNGEYAGVYLASDLQFTNNLIVSNPSFPTPSILCDNLEFDNVYPVSNFGVACSYQGYYYKLWYSCTGL